MRSFYDRYWKERQSSELQDFRFKWKVLQKYIPANEGGTILDYGCGKGKVMAELTRMNSSANIMGMDVSEVAVKAARRNVRQAVVKKIAANESIPLKSHSVDFLVCLDVIEHVYDVELLLSEFFRILKPDGELLLSTPFHGVIKNLIICLVGFETVFDPTGSHIRFFTKKSLVDCLAKAGFVPKHIGHYGRFYPVNNAIFVLAQKPRI